MATSLPLNQPHLCNRRAAMIDLVSAVSTVTFSTDSTTWAAPTKIPTWRLPGGVEFPTLALNTANLNADETERAYRNALAVGISHVEFHPGIERDGVARVLRSSNNFDRKSFFLTTKIETQWERSPSPDVAATFVQKQLDQDLSILGVDYVDMLMLRESTDCAVMQAMWVEMEKAKAEGRTRSIGVVNYCEGALRCLLSTAKERPSVNYIQMHAGMGPDSRNLRSFGESFGIRTFAYGHLGERAFPANDTDELLNQPTLKRIASAHGNKSIEDVALRWVLQNGAAASIRPTSDFALGRGSCAGNICADGLRKSANAFSWKLSAAEMKEIDALSSPKGNPTLFSSPGCPDSFFAKK